MNTDQLREKFPDEDTCRNFFESIIWQNGRICPHCQCQRSYHISGDSARAGLYECAQCKRQFTVTTKTPMHSTKLSLWRWLLVMYYMVNSSKGISSVFLAKWIGISQKSAWKVGHAVRKMMEPGAEIVPALSGIVELDEKYVGGKPRYQKGVKHKRGKGTEKQCVLVAVERNGAVRTAPVDSDKVSELSPQLDRFVDKHAHLMTDENRAYRSIGKQYAAHDWVNHSNKEYARGDIHNNTAESFSAIVERAKQGVFHYLSKKHLPRYLHEIGFRWDHRLPELKITKKGQLKIVMKRMSVTKMLRSLLSRASGRQLRRSVNGGIRSLEPYPI